MLKKTKLDIVLRTCTRTGVFDQNKVPRIVDDDRVTLVSKCISSLVESMNRCPYDIRFTIFDDHSDETGLARITQIANQCRHPMQLFNTQILGFNNSAFEQFQFGRDHGRELVYFVEDDYFHEPHGIQLMVDAYNHFRELSGINEVAISPWDQPDEYELRFVQPTKLFHFQDRYWRTTISTTNTVLWNVDIVRMGWHFFETLALQYGKVQGVEEINTTGLLLNNTIQHRGPVCCFSPIPSVALHIHHKGQGTPKMINTNMFEWQKQWQEFEMKNI